MPGLTLVHRLDGNHLDAEALVAASRGSEILPDYTTEVLFRNPTTVVLSTAYPDYPVAAEPNRHGFGVIEGVLYDRPETGPEGYLQQLRACAFPLGTGGRTDLASNVSAADGEYVSFLVDERRGDICVINDYLGRLPLYYVVRPEQVVVSRSIDFIRSWLGIRTLDTQSVAEYLMFSYPLEERTLFPGVRRLEAASCLEIPGASRAVREHRFMEYSFEEMTHAGQSQTENASNLVELFVESSRKRLARSSGPRVLSLSGGMDARNLAGAFRRFDEPITARTFLDPLGSATADVRTSRQIAEVLDIPWKLVDLSAFDDPDNDLMIRMKNGMNSTAMSFILEYFVRLRSEFGGAAWLFTGDGAGLFKDVLLPRQNLTTDTDVVQELLRFHARLTLPETARLLGLRKNDLFESMREFVRTLPEQDPNQKFKHVVAHSYYRAWLFEGEDRNRHYFWSTSPFFDPAFYLYVKNCPDEGRCHYGLYEEMTSRMTPSLDEVPNADTGRIAGDPYETTNITTVARKLLRDAVGLKKFVKAQLQHRRVALATDSDRIAQLLAGHATAHSGVFSGTDLRSWANSHRRHELYDLYLVDTICRTQDRLIASN